MPIQAVLFDKDLYNESQVLDYLDKHNLKPLKNPPIHTTKQFHRVRIRLPNFKSYFIKRIKHGIEYIIGM